MAVNQTQQEKNLAQIGLIKFKFFSDSSAAADWWNQLRPEWRGVVLHAAGISSGSDAFPAALCRCSWRELFARLDYRTMNQLRLGISHARCVFEGFGSLHQRDFSRRTAARPEQAKQGNPIFSGTVQMVVAPAAVQNMLAKQQGIQE